jgi:hypothetical protein
MRSGGGYMYVRARPHHVEVLDAGGVREVVPIHDVQWLLTSAIVAAAAVCVAGQYCANRLGRRRP